MDPNLLPPFSEERFLETVIFHTHIGILAVPIAVRMEQFPGDTISYIVPPAVRRNNRSILVQEMSIRIPWKTTLEMQSFFFITAINITFNLATSFSFGIGISFN